MEEIMGINIQFPVSNSTVPTGIIANGTADVTTISAVVQNSSSSVPGTVDQQPDKDGNFSVSFTNVPVGSGYTLTVSGGGEVGQVSNLTVQLAPRGGS
jgi:hypothetical protein